MNKAVLFFILSFLMFIKAYGQFPVEGDQDDAGFVSIFDGKTLDGWTGDPVYWRVENGIMIGEITPETIVKENTFIIYDAQVEGDFELKVSYRVSAEGNSGINYRSERIEGKPFALRGYQCDIDGKKRYVGQNYEEKKRTTLAYMGEKVQINNWKKPDSFTNLRANVKKNCWQTREVMPMMLQKDSLKSKIRDNDWNQVHIVAKGNLLEHYVNGILMSQVLDKDTINRTTKGYIGVQVHVGPPMTIEYKNFRIKKIIN